MAAGREMIGPLSAGSAAVRPCLDSLCPPSTTSAPDPSEDPMSATYEVRGPVAVITLNNPPVNGLGYDTRKGIAEGVDRAVADPAVLALVITGAGKAFSGGADIREFGSPRAIAEPNLLSLIRLLEDCPKPVVAAVHSVCMGGGLELSLGCHYRVASPGTSVALPEVKIGLVPGAGGTQRLPRALGVETALNMIISGEAVKSEVLAALPGQKLFDRIVEGELLAGALAFAGEVAGLRPLPRVRDLPARHPNADAYFQFARNTAKAMARNLPAPARCVDCIEQSVKSRFEEGMVYEREAFLALMMTPECKALRHAFFAERAASKIADVPEDTALRKVESLAVIGAGTMGGGITMNFLNAGIAVTLLETRQEALDRGLATIRRNYEAQVRKGKLKADKLEQRMGLLKTTLAYDDIKDADMVIEAVFEEMGVKEQVFRTLDEVMKPGAILATNTSTLDVDRIAGFTRRPQDVIGTHFFSPANVMKLLEVVRGKATAKDVLATVMALARKIRKTAVVSGVCDGFIGNRMIEQYGRQAGFLLEEGCTPQQVDRAIEKFGFAMGPFRMNDLAGNDIGWAIRKRRYVEKPQMRYSRTADLLCEMGRYGQKTSAGWYDYAPGKRDPVASPLVVEMIEKHRTELGLKPRRIADEEIVQRLVYALVNEGARILEDGIAGKASDIDMVYLTGYGFPLHRGGPMCYADTVGLFNVVQAMKRFAANPRDDAAFWQPAPLLARLAAEGKTFS
jgi:3-hydroxyacyl-CoA dehydrogenase